LQAFDLGVFLVEFEFQGFGGRNPFFPICGCPILSRSLRKGGSREASDHGFEFVILPEVPQRTLAGDGLDAANSGRDAAFFQNFDESDFSRSVGVGASAEFGGEISDFDDADPVAVFLSEQRHRLVFVNGDVDGDVFDHFDLFVAQDFFVDQVFDVLQFFIRDAGEVREIKTQMIGRDQRPRLLDVLAQNFAQASLQQVRGGVVAHGGLADVGVDDGIDFVADTKGAPPFRVFWGGWGLYDDLMRAHALNRGVAAFHFGDKGVVIVAVQPSAVADLATGLGVERGVVENDFALLAGFEFLRALPILDNG